MFDKAEWQRQHRRTPKGRLAAIRYRHTDSNREAQRRYNHSDNGRKVKLRIQEESLLRRRARIALNNAVRDGRINQLPCEVCGSIENLEAHHDDYTKPLEVQWLCRDHHVELRRELGI